MEFWIDQYDADLDVVLSAAEKIAVGKYDDPAVLRLRSSKFDSFTNAGLLQAFCELVMIFDLKSLGRHDGKGLVDKAATFLNRLTHSNFVEDDANVLAAVVIHLMQGDAKLIEATRDARMRFSDTTYRPDYVHPRIHEIARNLHPGVDEIFQQLKRRS